MSTNKFLDLMVSIEDQKWSISYDGYIRNEKGQCPICAIVDVLSNGEIVYTWDAGGAWSRLVGQSVTFDEYSSLVDIIRAADHKNSYLRKELMDALHVQE